MVGMLPFGSLTWHVTKVRSEIVALLAWLPDSCCPIPRGFGMDISVSAQVSRRNILVGHRRPKESTGDHSTSH
jgi:hypothetical protein